MTEETGAHAMFVLQAGMAELVAKNDVLRNALFKIRDWQLRDERNNPNVPAGFEGSPFDYLRKLANDAIKADHALATAIRKPHP